MIKSIKIENFKSLKEVNFEVPDFAVLVGYNGSGKTNFVNALHLVSLLAQGEQIEEALSKLNLFSRELLFDTENTRITFSINLLISGSPVNYTFTIEQKSVDERLKYRISREILMNGVKNRPILQRTHERISLGTEEENQLKEAELVANQLALSVFKKPQIISEVQQVLSSIVISDLSDQYLRKAGAISNIEAGLRNSLAESLFEFQSKNLTEFNRFKTELKKFMPELEELTIAQSKGRIILAFRETALKERQFSSYSTSDGNLRTMAILSTLLGEPKPSVFLVDEIENSFHPARIKSLMDFLKYVSGIEAGNLQIIVTTHSPVVLNYVEGKQLVYVYKKEGRTEIVNPHKDKRVWKHLEDSQDEGLKLGNLFASGILEQIFTSGN